MIGEFQRTAQINRMPINPLDKATIVSIYPEAIREFKATIFPGLFEIPAVTDSDGFELLVIGPSSWWKEMEEGQPYLEIPCSSLQVAESFIKDFSNGALGNDSGSMTPGLFFVPGEFDEFTIHRYPGFDLLLDRARQRQKNWFMELVQIADILWARTNGNPLAISKTARMAAEKLGLQKTWMQDFKSVEMSNCPACGAMVNPLYPVCSNCKNVINKIKAAELGLIFAQ